MLKRLRPELPDGCISDLSFDGLRAGELSSAAQREVRDHVSHCARCRERQGALDAAFAQAQAQLPLFAARPAAAQLHEPPAAAQTKRPSRRPAIYALALAACVLLGLLPWAGREAERDTRTKGGPGLSFYIKRGADVFAWTPGEAVIAGDVLRFVVSPRGYTQIAILSRADDGETSLYYPQTAHSAAIDAAADKVALDSAVELDDTIRDERLFAVFCRTPFATEALTTELVAKGALAAPPGCAVATLLLPKRRDP
jgi:hypothetical protein